MGIPTIGNNWYIILTVSVIALYIILHAVLPGKGKRGEISVANRLKKLPPEEYRIINDLMLKLGNWTSQIDHVVVSRYGVFVIETKNYQGWITGGENSDSWTQNIYGHKYSLHNPVHQNESHIKAIRKVLGDDGRIKMIPIVAFSRQATLRVKTEYAIVTYFRYLQRIILSYTEESLTDEQVSRIYRTLVEANVVDKQERKSHNVEVRQQAIKKDLKVANGICPRCGGKLIERKGKYGRFWGCSNYPNCKYTLNN